MTTVPDGVLQWLYNSLKPQYQYVDRTYSDIARTLSRFTSLQPKTDVYTFDHGSSALLLQLHGTLPVRFRGTEYRFPVVLWVPYGYPREPPMVFVTPTQDMAVRPGQHVSSDGRVYHPYLAQWNNHWDKSNIFDTLEIVADIFGKEPPVISRLRQPPQAQQALPLDSRQRVVMSPQAQQVAPLPPPKPIEARTTSPIQSAGGVAANTISQATPSPPALPSKPGHQNGFPVGPLRTGSTSSFRYASPSQIQSPQGPPPPPLPVVFPGHPNEVEHTTDGMMRSSRSASLYDYEQPQSPPGPVSQHQMDTRQTQYGPPTPQPARTAPVPFPPQLQQQHFASRHQPFAPQRQPFASQQQPPRRKLVEDLMSSPLETPMPSQSNDRINIPAPPIPPNPEKDALLHAISQALISRLREITSQNMSALPALEAQNAAMQQAYQNLSSELEQLQTLDSMLMSNEKILHDTMRDADRMMDNVKRKELPKIDDVLVAPTMVGEQLYGLVADERALGDAMFALTRAMDRGVVGADVYVKQTRSLAREQFFKKALIKKIGKGMGLSVDGI